MTMRIPYWHVDAFSAQAFGGNQAAVMVLEEWLPDEVLVAIAAENLFAETAFVVRDASGEADWELRWCTPTYEMRAVRPCDAGERACAAPARWR
jgi:PhzF family phenazine biosynthesis protein